MTVLNGSAEQEDVRSKCNCHLFATQIIGQLDYYGKLYCLKERSGLYYYFPTSLLNAT